MSPSMSRNLFSTILPIIIISSLFTTSYVQSQAPVVVSPSSWCVTRSDVSNQALQRGLDYACATGADCSPLLPNGLCFLPNTLAAHASYAFNSYYQRKSKAPGSCDFGGTALVAKTDPSYGSCVYPHSLSNAGGAPVTPSTTTTPTTTTTVPTITVSPFTGSGSPPGVIPTPLTTSPDFDSTSDASCLELQLWTIVFIFITITFAGLVS